LNFRFVEPWHVFLPRQAGHIVGLCGSGGKTSLLEAIAGVWREDGFSVVATTTTRTEPVASFAAAPAGGPGFVYRHGGVRGDGKWSGLAPEAVDTLEDERPGSLVIVEVDGAAKLPCKYYRAGEPVWPARTSLAIVVMGIGSVGERAGAVVHRLGRDGVSDPVGVAADAVWEWDHLLSLLTGPGGYLDHVPEGVPVVLALAGLEQQPDSVGLFDFTGRAMADPRLPLVMFCSRGEAGLAIRTACREDLCEDIGFGDDETEGTTGEDADD
jgi:probable selenium-dependent hydroxylase accessory protein YqeC